MKLHFLAAGKGPFACLACALAVGRCIQDVVDQLIRTDKDRYAASESLPGKHVNRNVGGSRRPQAGESSARVARTQILSNNTGALVLFDFASAFPSMSQAYMFNLLTALGVPRNALNLIQALYDNNRCTLQTNGAQVDGFKMTAGVRQGCPLSPLLYAICAELLIERIRMELPTAVVRAYADDTAVLIQNLWTDTPILAKIFADFGNMSNLRLNLNKTVFIPLFPHPDLATVQSRLTHTTPLWNAVQFSYSARYLGFTLGPEADDKSWQEPTAKFLRRAQAWTDQQLGLYCTTTSYNVFALSVLTYIAQVLTPTPETY